MIVDYHTHTHHSFDSMMKPLKILRIAKQRGLDAIVINDHNTIAGGLEAARINPFDDLRVIIGAEIKTDLGDVSGIFLKEEIQSRTFPEVIREIKNQGGITILNHPYYHHKLDEINYDGIDLIEGYNSRLPLGLNRQALQLAKEKSIPAIAGSDAHIYSDIGRCVTEIEEEQWCKPKTLQFKRNSFYSTLHSQFIKAIKTRDMPLFLRMILYTPKFTIKRLNELNQ